MEGLMHENDLLFIETDTALRSSSASGTMLRPFNAQTVQGKGRESFPVRAHHHATEFDLLCYKSSAPSPGSTATFRNLISHMLTL